MVRPSRGHSGQAIVEYSLLIAFLCLGCIVAIGYLRDGTRETFERQGEVLGAPTFAASAYLPPPPTATATATATLSPVGGDGMSNGASGPAPSSSAAPTATPVPGVPTATTSAAVPTSTPTVVAAVAPTPTAVTSTEVRLTAAVTSSNSQNTAYALLIENIGTTPVSGLKARIYLDLSEVYEAGLTASNVVVDPHWNNQCASAQFSPPATTNAASYIYYIDVAWPAHTLIVPGPYYTPDSFCNVTFAVRLSSWQYAWNGANDPSYQGTPYGSLGSASGILLYRNGVLISGSQP